MADLSGKTLGKYQILTRLGRGGMADVYRAFHPRLNRYVAVKVLHDFLVEGQDFLTRFEREARAIASLRHASIIQVFDFDVEAETYYMVMEFIDGMTLKERLTIAARQGECLPYVDVLNIFSQVAQALHHAHQHNMLHRDIKPSNIMLDQKGIAYLMDFGIARILEDSKFTLTGALIGTPAYMSPEQCQGLTASPASDIYSLGIVLYEMVIGKVPFDADTPFAVLRKQMYDPLPLPSAVRPDIPRDLEKAILKAVTKSPEDRYQDALEMLSDVQAALVEKGFQSPDFAISAQEGSSPEAKVAESVAPPAEKDTTLSELELPLTEQMTMAMTEAESSPEEKESQAISVEKSLDGDQPVKKKQEAEQKKPAVLPVRRRKAAGLVFAMFILVVGLGAFAWLSGQGFIPAITWLAFSQPTATRTARPTHTTAPTSPAQAAGGEIQPSTHYWQGFDEGMPQDWYCDPSGWQVGLVGNSFVLEGAGHRWCTLSYQLSENSDVSFKVRLENENSGMHANILQAEGRRYLIGFWPDGSYIQKQVTNEYPDLIDGQGIGNTWVKIKIELRGSQIMVYKNGEMLMAVEDNDAPYLHHTLAFEPLGGVVFLDDVEIFR